MNVHIHMHLSMWETFCNRFSNSSAGMQPWRWLLLIWSCAISVRCLGRSGEKHVHSPKRKTCQSGGEQFSLEMFTLFKKGIKSSLMNVIMAAVSCDYLCKVLTHNNIENYTALTRVIFWVNGCRIIINHRKSHRLWSNNVFLNCILFGSIAVRKYQQCRTDAFLVCCKHLAVTSQLWCGRLGEYSSHIAIGR